MKKNVFRNFDFVVCQTDKMKEIQKIDRSAYFVQFLPYIYTFFLRYYLNEISTVEKKRFFSKTKVMLPPGIIP